MNDLKDKVILVTGGNRGVGKATAEMLVSHGAKVAISARNKDLLDQVQQELTAKGGFVRAYEHDVSCEEDWGRVINGIESDFGALHGLVNNAGVHKMSKLENTTLGDFDWLMSINTKSIFLGCRAAFETIPKYNDAENLGSIVNVSSTAGLIGNSFQTVYNMSKGAVQLFTKSCAKEAVDRGLPIRINAVNPGMIETDMGGELVDQLVDLGLAKDAGQSRKQLYRPYLNGRFAKPQEVASAICFLLSSQSSFTTGGEITVDGSYSAGR